MQVSSSSLLLFSEQPILLVSSSSQNNQRKTKEIKVLPLLRTTKEKVKKPKAKTKKPSKKSKETSKQRQSNLAMHGWSGDKDQLCSSTLVRSFFFLLLHSFFFTLFFTLFLCYCLHLRHEQGNRVSQAQVLRAKSSFLYSRCQFPKQFGNVAN